MSSIPKVSVLMPVYNSELYIEDAINSILNQTFRDFEFIIIDDASTDKTLEIIKSFKDSRIQLIIKSENSGYTNSLNYGLNIAKGEYIARMDGDDISLPKRFEKQVAFMDSNKEVVVCGTTFSIIGTNNLISVPEMHNNIITGMLAGCKIAHPSVMLRKSVFTANNIVYDTQMEPAEDYALWVKLATFGKLHNLQECLLNYRIHNNQVSNKRNEKQIESAKQTRLKLLFSLNTIISIEQQKVYLKAIDSVEKLNFDEFLIFLDLKKNMLKANSNFFSKDDFRNYWRQLEAKFNSYYFKNRYSYSLVILKNYLSVFNKMESQLSTKELLKLTMKSLVNYKVK